MAEEASRIRRTVSSAFGWPLLAMAPMFQTTGICASRSEVAMSNSRPLVKRHPDLRDTATPGFTRPFGSRDGDLRPPWGRPRPPRVWACPRAAVGTMSGAGLLQRVLEVAQPIASPTDVQHMRAV